VDGPPRSVDPSSVAARLAAIVGRIAAAGGDPQAVTVVAVTKGFGADAVAAAAAVGLHAVGESYAQEVVAKLSPRSDRATPVDVHFIGRLQSNKVAMLAPFVDVWQSVDRPSLVEAIARRAPGARVFVQVNVSDEPQKGGCAPADADALVALARRAGLQVDGLMCVGRTGAPEGARSGFRTLRQLADSVGVVHRSMGMTDDLEVAVQEGATMIRVGTALFGAR
jgi:PLP dependent protein